MPPADTSLTITIIVNGSIIVSNTFDKIDILRDDPISIFFMIGNQEKRGKPPLSYLVKIDYFKR